MKLDPRKLVGPLAAFLLLALTLQQTSDALRRSGAWRESATAPANTAASPFARLDEELRRRTDLVSAETSRDPFDYRSSQAPRPTQTSTPRPRPAPPPPARPVLTAIIFDSDPRALVRFDGRDYTVRDNSLFSDFRVVRITRDEVVLDKSGQSLVLRRPTGGS
jgi:hypothetical protein